MKIIIKFSKMGTMRFIGHLDLMRYFQKCFRRACVPISMSKGFSPHQLLSFASPLGLGVTSEGDYLDAVIDTDDESYLNDLKRDMNDVLNDEIRIISIHKIDDDIKSSMSLLCACDYAIYIKNEKINNENSILLDKEFIKNKIREYTSRENIFITKKTKKSEKTTDIKDYIYNISASISDFSLCTGNNYINIYDNNKDEYTEFLYMQLTSGSSVNIKPELIVADFLDYYKIPHEKFDFQIHRLEMYRDKNFKKGELHNLYTNPKADLTPIPEYF